MKIRLVRLNISYANEDIHALNSSLQNRTASLDDEVLRILLILRDLDSKNSNQTINLLFKRMQKITGRENINTNKNLLELYKQDDIKLENGTIFFIKNNLLVFDRANRTNQTQINSKNNLFTKRLNGKRILRVNKQ